MVSRDRVLNSRNLQKLFRQVVLISCLHLALSTNSALCSDVQMLL